MMKMIIRMFICVSVLLLTMISSSYANDTSPTSLTQEQIADTGAIFEADTKQPSLAVLSQKEMEQTSAAGWIVIRTARGYIRIWR